MVNPALTALLDSIPTNTLPFALVSVPLPLPPNAQLPPGATPPTQQLVVCPTHKNVICEACGVDFGGLNYMQQFLKDAPAEAVPPPPNMQPPQGRADAIKNAKDAGNVSESYLFRECGRWGAWSYSVLEETRWRLCAWLKRRITNP
jgi:translocation protein SEC72